MNRAVPTLIYFVILERLIKYQIDKFRCLAKQLRVHLEASIIRIFDQTHFKQVLGQDNKSALQTF